MDCFNLYQDKRNRKLTEQLNRRNSIFAKHPDIEALDRKYQALQSKRAYYGHNELYDEILNVYQQIAILLDKHGYKKDSLEYQPDCSICMDKGEIDGKYCKCHKKLMVEQAERISGLKDKSQCFENFSLDVFASEVQKKGMAIARDYCIEYAKKVPHTEKPNIILTGSIGLGKTFLLSCIGYEALSRGLSVNYITSISYLQYIMNQYIGEKDYGLYQRLLNCDLLLLDDMGTEPAIKNISEEYMYALINSRTLEKKPFVAATNQSADQLVERYGQRTVSRMLDVNNCTLLTLQGKDVRLSRR